MDNSNPPPQPDSEEASAKAKEKEKNKKILKELGVDEDISLGYIPAGAELNVETSNMDSPKTLYNKRKSNIDRNTVKKIAGGDYGNKGS